jgi:hypothetical protein
MQGCFKLTGLAIGRAYGGRIATSFEVQRHITFAEIDWCDKIIALH